MSIGKRFSKVADLTLRLQDDRRAANALRSLSAFFAGWTRDGARIGTETIVRQFEEGIVKALIDERAGPFTHVAFWQKRDEVVNLFLAGQEDEAFELAQQAHKESETERKEAAV